jgi:hypothetical protein
MSGKPSILAFLYFSSLFGKCRLNARNLKSSGQGNLEITTALTAAAAKLLFFPWEFFWRDI